MLNGVRSDGSSARLSATVKPRKERRMYVASTDDRRPNLLLERQREIPVRWAHAPPGQDAPDRSCWSARSRRSAHSTATPQKSPPLARRSCASGLRRSQSGTKLPFASVQARVTPAVPNGGCRLRHPQRRDWCSRRCPRRPRRRGYLPSADFDRGRVRSERRRRPCRIVA